MTIRTAEDRFAICVASAPRASVLDAQIFRASVSPGRNGFSAHVGDARFQDDQLISVLIPAVYRRAAASPKPRPAARMTPVMILGAAAGRRTVVIVCLSVAPIPMLPFL